MDTSNPSRELYAIAAERPVYDSRGKIDRWVPEITHVHAFDIVGAKHVFLQDIAHRMYRIVAVGRVIGFHVEDEHGDFLRA